MNIGLGRKKRMMGEEDRGEGREEVEEEGRGGRNMRGGEGEEEWWEGR